MGVYGPTDNLVPIGNVVNKGLTIRASQTGVKRPLPRLIDHVQKGVLNPKALITHRIPLGKSSRWLPPLLRQARQLHQARSYSFHGPPVGPLLFI